MPTKSNHHYVPQFYLRGFSDGTGRQARVFAFDSNTKKSFTTLVRNIGSQRHFNRIQSEGVHPDHLEDALSAIEGEISPLLAEIVRERRFPTFDHFNSTMNLIALLSVRNPRLRGNLTDFHQRIAKRLMALSLRSREFWESQIKKARDDGVPIREDMSFDVMQSFISAGNYEIVIDQTYLIDLEMKMVDPVLKCLSRRHWCFASTPAHCPFITSDDPVVLDWTDAVPRPNPYSPGHGLQNTIVLFPLCSTLALVGLFNDLPQSAEFTESQVTTFNTQVASNSRNQIYARDGNFRLNLKDRPNVRGADLPRIFLGRA